MGQNVTYASNARKQAGQASHVWSDAMIKLRDKLNAAGTTWDKAGELHGGEYLGGGWVILRIAH